MSLYSSLSQVLAPFAAKINGLLTGYDGTVYDTPGEAVRTQINALHVLIGDEPGTAIDASAIGYGEDSNVEDAIDGLNERLGNNTVDWTDDYAIQSTSGATVSADGQSYATFDVIGGCRVKGYTRGGAGASRGCAFYDKDDQYISGSYNPETGTYDWNYDIVVPDNATKFKITCNTSYKTSFVFALTDITTGLFVLNEQVDANRLALSKAFDNYKKINIIEGILYTSISSSSVGAESVSKNQISFYFPVESGGTYTVDKKIATALTRIAYSATVPTYLSAVTNYENLGSTGTYKTFTAPIDGYAIVYVYNRSNDGDDKFEPIKTGTVAYEYAHVPQISQNTVKLTSVENVRHIFYCGPNRPYTKLTDAIAAAENYMDSILYVDAGTYNLVNEFGSDWFEALTDGSTLSGIVLKNRVHIIFSPNSKVVSHYNGNNPYAMSLYSPFNAGPYGFIVENLNLECSMCRYGVHDERNGNSEQYKSAFINCKMSIDNSANTYWTPRHCIGGGLGSNAKVIIDGCYFETDLATNRGGVYYHQSNDIGNADFKSVVTVKNCYFKTGTVTFSDARTDCTSENTIYSAIGNSMIKYTGTDTQGVYSADVTSPTSEVLAWNNNIREA